MAKTRTPSASVKLNAWELACLEAAALRHYLTEAGKVEKTSGEALLLKLVQAELK